MENNHMSNPGPSSHGTTTAATTFYPFRRLPEELQIEIWEIAAQEPRIIECCPDPRSIVPAQYYTPTPAPSIFSACSQSRKVAKKFYEAIELVNVPPHCGEFLCETAYIVNHPSYPKACRRTPEQIAFADFVRSTRTIRDQYDHTMRSFDQDVSLELHRACGKAVNEYIHGLVPFRTYINWSQDTLFINATYVPAGEPSNSIEQLKDLGSTMRIFDTWIQDDLLRKLKHLAINITRAPPNSDWRRPLSPVESIDNMESFLEDRKIKLETLSLVCQNELVNFKFGPTLPFQFSPNETFRNAVNDYQAVFSRLQDPLYSLGALFDSVSELVLDRKGRSPKELTFQTARFDSSLSAISSVVSNYFDIGKIIETEVMKTFTIEGVSFVPSSQREYKLLHWSQTRGNGGTCLIEKCEDKTCQTAAGDVEWGNGWQLEQSGGEAVEEQSRSSFLDCLLSMIFGDLKLD